MDCICKGCSRPAREIREYQVMVIKEGYADENEAVRLNDETYDKLTDTFYCTKCYIEVVIPTIKRRH